jgi:hypothetical protein
MKRDDSSARAHVSRAHQCPPCTGNCRQGRDCPANEAPLERADRVLFGVALLLLVPSAIAMLVGMGYTAWVLLSAAWRAVS